MSTIPCPADLILCSLNRDNANGQVLARSVQFILFQELKFWICQSRWFVPVAYLWTQFTNTNLICVHASSQTESSENANNIHLVLFLPISCIAFFPKIVSRSPGHSTATIWQSSNGGDFLRVTVFFTRILKVQVTRQVRGNQVYDRPVCVCVSLCLWWLAQWLMADPTKFSFHMNHEYGSISIYGYQIIAVVTQFSWVCLQLSISD